jgi:hypothetical protein
VFVAADVAYIVMEYILIPFTESQCQDWVKDAFTFFLSQFGLLTTEWCILWHPLECSLLANACIL